MRRGFCFPKRATQSEHRTSKRRRNTLGLSPYHRRLACEALEDRRLLSDGAVLISQTINNAQVNPGAIFTETWTIQNIGTSAWSAGATGYTLNLVGKDELGAVPLSPNTDLTYYHPYGPLTVVARSP